MSRIVFIIKFGIAAASQTIPVEFDHLGHPNILVSFVPYDSAPHRIHLGSQGSSVRTDDRMVPQEFVVHIDTSNVSHDITFPAREHVLIQSAVSSRSRNSLAIGQRSDFLNYVGHSLAFVRTGQSGDYDVFVGQTAGFLLINSTLEEFENHYCVPGSLGRFRQSVSRETGAVSDGRARMVVGDEVNGPWEVVFCDSDAILTAPLQSLTQVYDRLLGIEALRPYQLLRFGNCRNTLRHLPPIILMSESLILQIYPDDYTRQIGNDECELLLSHNEPWEGRIIRFNPVLIKGLNFHASHNQISICEASE